MRKGLPEIFRVILLPELVPSASSCLGSALKKRGHQVKILSRHKHRFGFQADEYVLHNESGNLKKFLNHLFAGRYLFSQYDIVHFNYGSTLFDPGFDTDKVAGRFSNLNKRILRFLQLIEIFILRLRKIPIFVHYQGDDAVQGDVSLRIFDDSIAAHVDDLYYSKASDSIKRRRILWFSQFAEEIFCVSPDMKWFLPERAKFIPYACTNILALTPRYESSLDTLKISHAPSDRGVKGTEFLVSAVQQLQADGYAVELEILENLSHAEVIQRIGNCDIFVDQLHHGWYGGVAVEAMALGKPVICFIREKDLVHVPSLMAEELPIIRSNPLDIYETLVNLESRSRTSLREMGKSSRIFVETWHDSNEITNEILECYKKSYQSNKIGLPKFKNKK